LKSIKKFKKTQTRIVSEEPTREELLEILSDLVHRQWAHWTRYMLDNYTPENVDRWRRQLTTGYKDLSEPEKDSDRVWASTFLFHIEEWKRKKGKKDK
jgi:hypothetical protein